MLRKPVDKIRISKRLIRLGDQIYPLANISRIQTHKVVPRLTYTRITVELAAILTALALMNAAGSASGLIRGLVTIAVVGTLMIRAAYVLSVLIHRVGTRQRYALLLEAAGAQYTALSGVDQQEIDRIREEIANAIEDPPIGERVLHVAGDVVFGDKIGRDKFGQYGAGNSINR